MSEIPVSSLELTQVPSPESGYILTLSNKAVLYSENEAIVVFSNQEYLKLYQDCAALFAEYRGSPYGPPFYVSVQMDYDDYDQDQMTQNYKQLTAYITLAEAEEAATACRELIQVLYPGVSALWSERVAPFHVKIEVAPFVEFSELPIPGEPGASMLLLALYGAWKDNVRYTYDTPEEYDGEDDGIILQHSIFKEMTPTRRKEIFDFIMAQEWY